MAAMGGARAAVWTSLDGYTWTRVAHDEAVFGGVAGDEQGMESATSFGSDLVAVGRTAWTSPDGVTWSRDASAPVARDGEAFVLRDAVTGGPGLIAVGGYEDEAAAIWVADPSR